MQPPLCPGTPVLKASRSCAISVRDATGRVFGRPVDGRRVGTSARLAGAAVPPLLPFTPTRSFAMLCTSRGIQPSSGQQTT